MRERNVWLLRLQVLGLATAALVATVLLLDWIISEAMVRCDLLYAFRFSKSGRDVGSLILGGALSFVATIVFVVWVRKFYRFVIPAYILLGLCIQYGNVVDLLDDLERMDESQNIAICQKGTDDGMELTLDKLTPQEYAYITNGKWPVHLPAGAQSASIDYWRDNWFGEYSIQVHASIPADSFALASADSTWKLVENKPKRQVYLYEDSNY